MGKKIWANYIVSVLLLLAFIIMLFTGLYKFALVYGLFPPGPKGLPLFLISRMHDFIGVAMVVLVLVHIILNWSFITNMTKRLFRR